MPKGRTLSLRIDRRDPVSRFLRDRLGWGWPSLLLVTFLLYGPIEKLLIPYLGGYLGIDLDADVRTWVPDVEALLTGFVEFPFFFAYYLWSSSGVGEVFVSLKRNRSFHDPRAYEGFLARVDSSFNRRRWTAIAAAFAVAAVLLWHFVLWGPGSPVPPWFGSANVPHRTLSLAMIGLVAYAIAQVLVREVLAMFWLRRLCSELGPEIVVHPYHADDAGGLGGIARHAFSLSFFLVPLLLFITMGSLLPSLRQAGPLGLNPWTPALTLGWLLFLIFLGSVLISLFGPPHRIMEAQRDHQINEISDRLDELLAGAQQALDGSPEKVPAMLEEIESLKAARSLLIADFPVWPLNTSLRVKLGTTSLVSLAAPALNYGWAALLRLLGQAGK